MPKSSTSLRNDVIVTARVPREIKRRGDAVLKKIGATPTQLINASYEYVLACNGLPNAQLESKQLKPGKRTITSSIKKKLQKFEQSTVRIDDRYVDMPYEQMRNVVMQSRFAESV